MLLFEKDGWRVIKNGKVITFFCPCPGLGGAASWCPVGIHKMSDLPKTLEVAIRSYADTL